MIPRRFIRTVPERAVPEVEEWWREFGRLHEGWEFVTYRDPLDPRQFPFSSPHWERCTNGAQLAGLVRLEALLLWGGIYVDSDVEPYRSFAPLLACEAFAGWEDAKVVPDAIIGAQAQHPAIAECLQLAIERLEQGAWESGPGVTTSVLPGRPDVLLLPPGSLYPYHYSQKHLRSQPHAQQQPWAFAAHHWHGSWLTAEQRAAQARRRAIR